MKKAEKIGIIAKTTREESRQVVEKLVNYLRRKKAKFFLDEDTGTLIGAKGILKRDQIASKVDLLVVIAEMERCSAQPVRQEKQKLPFSVSILEVWAS